MVLRTRQSINSDSGGFRFGKKASMARSPVLPPMQLLALALLATMQLPPGLGLDNGLALTPPLGYNAYMSGISETVTVGARC